MATSNMKASIPCDIHSLWKVITEIENYTWRSDLSKTEVISDQQFVEYTKEGYPTTFTITSTEPYKRWEFDMENSNMKGHWVGVFTSNGDETEIDFTEQVTAKKFFMKPFIKSYLKKQQAQFVADLKKAVLASVYQGTIRSKMADLRSCCVTFTPRTSSTRRSSALQEHKSSHF